MSPLGIGTEESWQAIRAGRPGISRIENFDSSAFSCRIAGEIKNFDPSLYIEKKEIKKMGRFIQLGIAASEFALAQSGLRGGCAQCRAGGCLYRQRHRRIRSDRARAQDTARKRSQPHLAVFHSGHHHQSGLRLRFHPHRRQGSQFSHRHGLHHQRPLHRRFFQNHPARRRGRHDLRRAPRPPSRP